jgi:dUTP pyrophosphatase
VAISTITFWAVSRPVISRSIQASMTGSYAPSYDRPVLEVPVMRLDPDLELPTYARVGDAGLDLLARETIVLLPAGGRALVPTGLAVAIPEGHAGFVQPRSGLALKNGVTCLNTPGLIDSGYRGELKVLLVNTDPVEPFEVKRGERIAQLVVQRVEHVVLVPVEDFDHLGESDRGEGGFGHTGR